MTALPLRDAAALFVALDDFLQVAVHTILYYRRLYPERAFLSATTFDVPVHQCRHPGVCAWVADAVDHVMGQVAGGGVERVAVVLHAPLAANQGAPLPPGTVLERWVFDVRHLPAWPGGADAFRHDMDQQRRLEKQNSSSLVGPGRRPAARAQPEADLYTEPPADPPAESGQPPYASTDLCQQLRGLIQRIAAAGISFAPLPPRCTFTVAVELSDAAQLPKKRPPETLQVNTTTPLRSVHADPLFMECWVEERALEHAARQ